tara:strand:- start:349 stop:594 length:246 start_codon:yes stop_codon:yes gene_type:complete
MTDMFMRAIKSQDNLDYVVPHRNHPLAGVPTPHAIECIKMFRKGLTPAQITKETGLTYDTVSGIVRRCSVEPSYNRLGYMS